MLDSFYDASAATGILTLTYVLYKVLAFVHFNLRPSSISRYHHLPAEGGNSGNSRPWALVTGSSDGLGLGFAIELASRDFNIVLHGRNEANLNKAKAIIQAENPVDIRFLISDASPTTTDWSEFERNVLSVLGAIHLTVVVNNLGGSSGIKPDWANVSTHTAATIDTFINVNSTLR